MKEIYSKRIAKLQRDGADLTNGMRRISLLRLALGLSAGFAFYLGFGNISGFFVVAGFLAAGFIYQVKQHTRLRQKYSENNILSDLNINELKNLTRDDDNFEFDPGSSHSSHVYANDLDVFGPLSLFRDINRTTTITGKQLVVNNLLNPGKEAIAKRKELLSELSGSVDWRQRFYAIGIQSGEKTGDIARLASWNAQPAFYAHRKHWVVIAGVLSFGILGLLLYMALFGGAYSPVLIFLFVLNSCIYQVFFRSKANDYFSRFGDFSKLFSTWSELCALITEKTFGSEVGAGLKLLVSDASAALLKISNLNRVIPVRSNGMMAFVMNGLCLFDVWFILQFEYWRSKNGPHLDQWIDSINQFDFLNSFANYKYNHPAFCDPEVMDGPNRISATLMGHPLIQNDRLVSNDFEIGISHNAQIITGSNMSGKSTFLRAVGLNMVLALNGLPVCARKFSCSNLSIATCIRINDSLGENQSYFRAEIKKLSQIMKLLESGRPYIVLLDEILRGTNSTDKQTGTFLFYQKIASLNCVALLATHDPEIGNLSKEAPHHFQNFHFESYVVDSEIQFDYILRPGVSNTKNATLLMKQLNLI